MRLVLTLVFFGCLPLTHGAEKVDPLRFVPDAADLVVKIEKPRQLIESILNREPVRDLLKLHAVRSVLDSHGVRIAFDVLQYFEKEMQTAWPGMLDRLASGGLVIASRTQGNKQMVLLVLQGEDEDFTRKLTDLGLRVILAEAGLAEAKIEPKKATYQGVEVTSLGDQLLIAPVGATLLVATHSDAMKAAIDTHVGDKKKSFLHSASLKQARGMLAPSPLLWGWANLEPVKQLEGAKEIFAQPRNNFLLTFFLSGWIDVVRRSPFVVLALNDTPSGMDFSIHLPAGRNGRGGDVVLHMPEDDQKSCSLPLLQPKGVLFSHSYYQDLGAMWTRREKVFNADTVKDFESNEKELTRFTLGTSLEKLLTETGPYHRFVAVQPEKLHYGKVPLVPLPALAHVVSLKNPEIGRSVEAMLRAGGFIAYTQLGVKLVEKEMHGVPTFGYRFSEKKELEGDEDGYRFNFAPTFAQVGNHYVFASTPELCAELIPLLQTEAVAPTNHVNMRMRFSAEGLARNLAFDPDSVVTRSVLEQGLTEKEAKREVELLVRYVEKLGTIDVATEWKADRFELKASWRHR